MSKNFITRGDCFVSALLQTLILSLQFGVLLFAFSELSWRNRGLFALLILLQFFSCAFFWRRFLTYNKKQEEPNHE